MASFFLTFLTASNSLMDLFNKVKACSGHATHTVLGQSIIIALFKQTNPELRGKKLLRNFKTHNPWEETGFFFPECPHLLCRGSFSLHVCCTCVSSPAINTVLQLLSLSAALNIALPPPVEIQIFLLFM